MGQRVRVVACRIAHEVVGKEATIIAFDDCAHGYDGRIYAGYDLDIDGVGRRCPLRGFLFCFEAHRLEPILPEGHKPCEEQFKRDLDRLLEREGATC